MKFNITKEQLEGYGKIGLKIGKSIIVEGTKTLALKGAAAVITTSFEEGFGNVKTLTLDEVLKGGKDKTKKTLFKQTIEEIIEVEEPVKAEVTK